MIWNVIQKIRRKLQMEEKKEEVLEKVEEVKEEVENKLEDLLEKIEEKKEELEKKIEDVIPPKIVEVVEASLAGKVFSFGCLGWKISIERKTK